MIISQKFLLIYPLIEKKRKMEFYKWSQMFTKNQNNTFLSEKCSGETVIDQTKIANLLNDRFSKLGDYIGGIE